MSQMRSPEASLWAVGSAPLPHVKGMKERELIASAMRAASSSLLSLELLKLNTPTSKCSYITENRCDCLPHRRKCLQQISYAPHLIIMPLAKLVLTPSPPFHWQSVTSCRYFKGWKSNAQSITVTEQGTESLGQVSSGR